MNKVLILLFINYNLSAQIMQQALVNSGKAVLPTIALAHESHGTFTSGTTHTVTLTASITAGNLVVVRSINADAMGIVSVSQIGTCTQLPVTDLWTTACYTNNSGAATTSVDVVMSGTATSESIDIREYSCSGAPCTALAVDAAGGIRVPSGGSSPYSGQSMTLTGTNDLVLQWTKASNNVTAVSTTPWTTNSYFETQVGSGTVDALNVTSFTAPSWTSTSSAVHYTTAVAFGFSTAAATYSALLDFSGGTTGNEPTAADLQTGTWGAVGLSTGTPNTDSAHWSITSAQHALHYRTAAHHTFSSGAPRFIASGGANNGGVTYAEIGSPVGLEFDENVTTSPDYISFIRAWEADFPNNKGGANTTNIATMGFWFQTTQAANLSVSRDIATLNTGVGFMNIALFGDGTHIFLQQETQSPVGSPLQISPNTWYWVNAGYNGNKVTVSTNGAVRDGAGNVTLTFAATPLGFLVGNNIIVAACTDSSLNGTFALTARTGTTVSYAQGGASSTTSNCTASGQHQKNVYDESLNLLNATTGAASGTNTILTINLGDTLGSTLRTGVNYFDKFAFCYIGNCPLPMPRGSNLQ